MKHLLISIIITLAASTSLASSPNSLYAKLGFRSGSTVFGAEFEHRMKSSHGIAAYFLSASKDDTLLITGLTSIGGVVKLHFGANRWDLYVAPGFGYHMMDFVGAAEDQSALGPLLQLGTLYRFTRQIAFGMEYTLTYNWLNGDTGQGQFNFMNLTAKYTF